MHIHDLLPHDRPSFSFEFFPPKTAKGADDLFDVILELEKCHPSFVSVTYGAGGSTRDLTHALVLRIKEQTSMSPIPHLTCVSHSRSEIVDILTRYAECGVGNILALRGDPPRGAVDYDHGNDHYTYAVDLVREIAAFGGHPESRGFGIGVAGFPEGHPATPNRLIEMDRLKEKCDAGADYICTQLFFDNGEFHDFRERCQLVGVDLPIIAGIMPITSLSSMNRMAELSGGTKFPAKLIRLLQKYQDNPDDVVKAGIDYATEQCLDLVANNVAGLHYYTLNKSNATLQIHNRVLETNPRLRPQA